MIYILTKIENVSGKTFQYFIDNPVQVENEVDTLTAEGYAVIAPQDLRSALDDNACLNDYASYVGVLTIIEIEI